MVIKLLIFLTINNYKKVLIYAFSYGAIIIEVKKTLHQLQIQRKKLLSIWMKKVLMKL